MPVSGLCARVPQNSNPGPGKLSAQAAAGRFVGLPSRLHGSTAPAFRRRPTTVMPAAAAASSAPLGTLPGDVVCVGEALYDLLADDLGKERDEVSSWTPYPGGAPANVATCLGRLGVGVQLVGAVGRDVGGDAFMELLGSRGVGVSLVQRPAERPTREVFVTRSADGDRAFAGFALPTSEYADCFFDAASLPEDAIAGAPCVVMGTLGLAYPGTREAMQKTMAAAKAAGVPVMVDVNWRHMFWEDPSEAPALMGPFVAAADYVKITDEEAEFMFGISPSDALANPSKVKEACKSAAGVLVTAGEKGHSYCFGEGALSGARAAFDVDIVDTTGAGDAFTAGFLYAALGPGGGGGGLGGLCGDAAALEAASDFAAACGALTCTRAGAIDSQPTAEEVREFLAG